MAGRFQPNPVLAAGMQLGNLAKSAYFTSEEQNSYDDVTHYNNFYEFGTDKSDPAKNSKNFNTSNWTVSVEGEVAKPRTFTMDEIVKLAPLEERIYRRSIVVPWIGYSFNALVKLAQPTSKAR
jgi:sulfoxide reductase catalytic subunit YedY